MLQKLGFLPGFNKQVTPTGAESQWTDGQNQNLLVLQEVCITLSIQPQLNLQP